MGTLNVRASAQEDISVNSTKEMVLDYAVRAYKAADNPIMPGFPRDNISARDTERMMDAIRILSAYVLMGEDWGDRQGKTRKEYDKRLHIDGETVQQFVQEEGVCVALPSSDPDSHE